jgi:hypothetical protein
MFRWPSFVLLSLCSSVFGCEVEIGDDCTTAADCSQEEPRLCLTQALEGYPGGYCTVFNCEPGTCPSEAVCVGYRSTLSDAAECADGLGTSRLQRTFCMRSCGSSSDCRSGYACIDVAGDDPWGAEVFERAGKNTKVCALAYSGPDVPEDRSSDVCRSDPGALPVPTVTAPGVLADGGIESTASDAGMPDAGQDLDAAFANDGGARDAAPSAVDANPAGHTSDAGNENDAAAAPDANQPAVEK